MRNLPTPRSIGRAAAVEPLTTEQRAKLRQERRARRIAGRRRKAVREERARERRLLVASQRSVAIARKRAELYDEMGVSNVGDASSSSPATPVARSSGDDIALRVQRSSGALTSRKRRLCALALDSGMAAVRTGVRTGVFDSTDIAALSCTYIACATMDKGAPLHRKTKRRRHLNG